MTKELDAQSTKYRLIGALVIIVSFGLAWLLLLDHDVKRQTPWSERVPEPLEIERFEIVKAKDAHNAPVVYHTPKQVDGSEQQKNIENAPLKAKQTDHTDSAIIQKPAPAKPISEIKPSPKAYAKIGSDGLPEAWVLQVASFKEKQNARNLQQNLLKEDIPAYTKAFNLSSGKIYRVLVGPKLNKKKASELSKKIEKGLGLKAMLVQYRPGFEE